MSKKRILVIITEGETDEEFYKNIIDEIKKVNDNKIFNFSEIKHICSKSITKMHKKMLGRFKNEVFKFAVKWKANRSLQDVRFKIIVRNYLDAPVGVAKTEPIACVKEGEERESLLEFDPHLLAEGRYYISLSIFQQDGSGNDLLLDHITRVTSFQKTNSEADGLVWSHFYWGSIQFDDMKLSDRK